MRPTFDQQLATIARAHGVTEDRAFDLIGAMDAIELDGEYRRALAALRRVAAYDGTPNLQRGA